MTGQESTLFFASLLGRTGEGWMYELTGDDGEERTMRRRSMVVIGSPYDPYRVVLGELDADGDPERGEWWERKIPAGQPLRREWHGSRLDALRHHDTVYMRT